MRQPGQGDQIRSTAVSVMTAASSTCIDGISGFNELHAALLRADRPVFPIPGNDDKGPRPLYQASCS